LLDIVLLHGPLECREGKELSGSSVGSTPKNGAAPTPASVRLALVWLRNSRTAGSIGGIVCTAIGLVVCALLLPGTTLDWRGLLIAVAVIDLPLIGFDRLLRTIGGKQDDLEHPGRWGMGFAVAIVWWIVGLAVADWVTPHFNIGGVWQYVVIWLVIFGLNHSYWKIVTTVTPDPNVE
jgi:hypothetical protein